MAYHPHRREKAGLSMDIHKKLGPKYDLNEETLCRAWIQEVTGRTLSNPEIGMHYFAECLKDGQDLRLLLNKLDVNIANKFHPGINEGLMGFEQGPDELGDDVKNIDKFIEECRAFGVEDGDLFQTADLYEVQNMAQVIRTIYALSSVAIKKGYTGSPIGVNHSDSKETSRFTEDEITQGISMDIGLQMGSQSGMNLTESCTLYGRASPD